VLSLTWDKTTTMTPDMRFEALLVSPNFHILKGVLETLEDLSMDVDICTSPSRAIDVLATRNVDLLVIDWDKGMGAAEVARTLVGSRGRRKMTIAALVEDPVAGKQVTEAGAHVVIQKPLGTNFKNDFRELVYSRMTSETREQPRYGVRLLVAAQDINDKPVPVTMIDISRDGVGLTFTGKVAVDDTLKFRLLLPEANKILRFDARILWTLPYNRAGAEFVNMSTIDADVLQRWLRRRHNFKKLATQ
jgi:hypothetical protein